MNTRDRERGKKKGIFMNCPRYGSGMRCGVVLRIILVGWWLSQRVAKVIAYSKKWDDFLIFRDSDSVPSDGGNASSFRNST